MTLVFLTAPYRNILTYLLIAALRLLLLRDQLLTPGHASISMSGLTYGTLVCSSFGTSSVAAAFGRHGMSPPGSNDTGTSLGQDGSD